MNITAFYEYLDSCFFQTAQMKAIKYLNLKKDKEPWLVTHSSCLIDEVFVQKYCNLEEKENKVQEMGLKNEQDKQEHLQMIFEEENKLTTHRNKEADRGFKDSLMDKSK